MRIDNIDNMTLSVECLLERVGAAGGLCRGGVEKVVLQVSPDKEGQTFHNAGTETNFPGLVGDGGGQLVVGHPPHHHSRQLVSGSHLGQPDQLRDGQGLEGGEPLLVLRQGGLGPPQLAVDISQADDQ